MGSNGWAIAGKNTHDKNAIILINPHSEFYNRIEVQLVSKEGLNVYIATFSACEKSVPSQYQSDILITEFKEASKALGVKSINTFLYAYEVRIFNEKRNVVFCKVSNFII